MSKYCTQIRITEKVRLDLFTPTCFRVRMSELEGDAFPEKYEIPFAVGKTAPWQSVPFEKSEESCTVTVKTSELVIKLRALDGYIGANFTVYDRDGRRLFPVDAPKYGMFVNKCIVFDSASFFGEYSGCSRYAHAFYDEETGEYSTMLERDAVFDIFFIYGKTYKDGYAQFNELVGAEPLLPKKSVRRTSNATSRRERQSKPFIAHGKAFARAGYSVRSSYNRLRVGRRRGRR